MLKREELKKEDTWAIEDLYAKDQDWEEDYNRLTREVEEFPSYAGKISKDQKAFAEFHLKMDAFELTLDRLYVYANQKLHENLGNSIYQTLASKADVLMNAYSQSVSFASPELLGMEEDTLLSWVEEDARLLPFKRGMEELIRQKKHVLSKEEERILAMAGQVSSAASDAFAMFNNADAKFEPAVDSRGKEYPLSSATYVSYLTKDDPVLRKSAFTNLYALFDRYKNTLSSLFYSNAKQADFYAKARGYKSARAKALFAGNIPESVYDNLIDTIHDRMDLMYRYVGLRKRALKLEDMHMYDIYVPLVTGQDRSIDLQEAKEMVLEGLVPMGEEYLQILKEGFDHRWMDIYPNEGKRSGAYSWGAYGVHPYVLLNFNGTMDDVFTIAHEMGHSIHTYYSNANQPFATSGYKIFVAEVASTCNESLLLHHLLGKSKSRKERMYLITRFLDEFKGTVYRQTMFAEFERDMHALVGQGEALTTELLTSNYYELNKIYFGDQVIIDPEISMEWARIPHFYTPFYVYQYATGFSAAIALSKKILNEGESAVADYKEFLKGGCSKDPIDLLKIAGVDMSKKESIDLALDYFEELLNEFESLLEEEEAQA